MALATEVQVRRATRENRLRQVRAETRMDEQVRLEEHGRLINRYFSTDARGDAAIKAAARHLHGLLTTEEQRNALYILMRQWMADEDAEESNLSVQRDHNDTSLVLHKAANPLFIDGQWVYGDDDGAA